MFQSLAVDGQNPIALVVGCVDSRVDPAVIFDTAPGDLLVVRNVANLVPSYAPDGACHGTSAALEFGICVLEIPNIIVLGHARCGGVTALLNGAPAHACDFVDPWMAIATEARAKALCAPEAHRQHVCEQESIKVSLANLKTFPWVAERVNSGTLALHGAWYDIESGILQHLQEDGSFKDVES